MDGPEPRPLRLRSRLLLAVLVGMVLPLALAGAWIAGATGRTGEALLRERLETTLLEIARHAGHNWVALRSDLLTFGESPAVRHLLLTPAGDSTASADAALADAWSALPESVRRGVIRGPHGSVRARIGTRDSATDHARSAPTIAVEVPIRRAVSGEHLGVLEARLETASLLPPGALLSRVGGSMFALFDATGTRPLMPTPVGGEAFSRARFQWSGNEWIVARHTLAEPPIELVLAGPIEPLTAPFDRATRQGLLALLAAAILGFFLIDVVTRPATRALDRLAQAAEDVSGGDLDRRVDEEGPDEARRLARAFNRMTTSLRDTMDRLSQREAVAAIGEYAASLAHEIRNPLTAMRVDLQRAAGKMPADHSSRPLIERALGEVRRLDAAVSGALKLSRSGRVVTRSVDPLEPLRAAADAARPRFEERGACLSWGPASGHPPPVRGDAQALEQLFLNLLLNAADATGEGGEVDVETVVRSTQLDVRITDDGIGIPASEVERVFDPFHSTKPEGTGLGLPIARRIARAMGGDIRIDSEAGHGTMVTVTLPRAFDPTSVP